MPALARRQYELGVAEAFDHLRAAREPERLPDLARRLPLEARAVGQQPADGQVAEPRLRQVPLEWVVERDVSVLDEEHHRCGGEGLRDRADAVLVVDGRVSALLRDSHRVGPDRLAAAVDSSRHARQAVASLPPPQDLAQLLLRLLRGHRAPRG